MLLLSCLSKWAVLLSPESEYGLVSELDRISPSQTENHFDLFLSLRIVYARGALVCEVPKQEVKGLLWTKRPGKTKILDST